MARKITEKAIYNFLRGHAVRKLKQLNGAYFNTPKVLAQFKKLESNI